MTARDQPRWRGWNIPGADNAPPVTSARLSSQAKVTTRLFPRIGSWIALGAPLELVSPLSLIRFLFLSTGVVWALEATYLRGLGERVPFEWGASGAAVLIWIGLIPVKKLGPRACHVLALLLTGLVGAAVWAARTPGNALGFTPFFILPLLFIALFFPVRATFAHTGVVVVAEWCALVTTMDAAEATVVTLATACVIGAIIFTASVLAGAVSRSGAVDVETGLPNDVGLARRLVDWDHGRGLIVASLRIEGLDDVRTAFGHGIGTELVRRAVEDLGQVLPFDAIIGRVAENELVICQPIGDTVDVVAADLDPAGAAHGNGAANGHNGRRNGHTTAADGTSTANGHARPAPETSADPVPAQVLDKGRFLATILTGGIAAGRYSVGKVEIALRGHVGLGYSPWDGTELAELVRRASLGAHRAAQIGAREVRWDRAEGTLTVEDLALLSDLRLAIERGELRLAYQPQVDARTDRVVSAEALLRWESPVHGNVPPGRFIVLAERTGYIDRLTEWVLEEALAAQARWRRSGLRVPISVNFSAKTLSRPDLPTWIIGELERHDVPPEALAVEVTETAAAELLPAVKLLQPLHDRGVRVSIDDFGTGYTSLAALPHLPLDELKVDMSFVRRSGESLADDAIVRAVRELAHRLELDSVAEGVENDEIRQRMTEIGFDLLQGYHFSKPLFEQEFLTFARGAGCTMVDA